MKLNTGVLFVLAVAAIVAAGAPRASAQTAGPRQGSNGLFGGGKSDVGAHQTLDLTVSPTQGYDSDLTSSLGTAVGLASPESTGYSTTVVGGAEYVWKGSHAQLRATGTSTMRYLRPLDDLYASARSVSHTAGVGIVARLPKRSSLLVNQTATYSPSYLYNLFPQAPSTDPGDAPPAPADYAVNGFESHTYGTAATLTHDFTARTSVLAGADYQNTETFSGTGGRRALGSYGIRGHFSHRLGANVAALVEYQYHNSEFQRSGLLSITETLAEHGVNIGLDYNRRLSANRRLSLGVLIGPSLTILPVTIPVSLPESNTSSPDPTLEFVVTNRRDPRISAQFTIGYDFARTWKLGAIYRRGVDYVPGLSQPIAADRFSTSVSGLLARRVDFLASAGYSNGASALNFPGATFNTYTGDVRLRYAFTQKLAAYVEYLYYFYDSRGGTPIGPGISAGLERKGVRSGLTLRVPALRR